MIDLWTFAAIGAGVVAQLVTVAVAFQLGSGIGAQKATRQALATLSDPILQTTAAALMSLPANVKDQIRGSVARARDGLMRPPPSDGEARQG